MKKVGMLALALVAAFSFAACSSGSGSQLKGDTESFQAEGWLNDDTFQVSAIGAPNKNAEGFVRRRTQSEEAALLAAQKRVIEQLVGSQIEGASGSDSGESTGIAISKQFQGVVKGGTIVKKSFDSNDNCEIVYRVQADGLKEMAQAQADKEDFR